MAGKVPRDLETLALLADPVRRDLYQHVARSREPVRVADAAHAVGVGRPLAAYHLQQLAEGGLLEVHEEERERRGVGRPPKLFVPSGAQFQMSLPPRSYDLAARLLAEAVERDTSEHARRALADVARELGERIGQGIEGRRRSSALRRIARALEPYGYEPVRERRGELCLRNCPFDALRDEHQELICRMNLAIAEGLVAGERDVRAVFEPRPDGCCVTFRMT